jgi:hypothetical protein
MRLVGPGSAKLRTVGTADKLAVYGPRRPARPGHAGSLHDTGNRSGGATASGQESFPSWGVGSASGASADNVNGVSAVRLSVPKTWIGVGMV